MAIGELVVVMHCNCSRKMPSVRHCCVVSSSQPLLAALDTPIARIKTVSTGGQGIQTPPITAVLYIMYSCLCRSGENGTVIIVQSGSGSHSSLLDWCMFALLTLDTGCQCARTHAEKKQQQRTTSSL